MGMIEQDGLRYYEFASLLETGVIQRIFTRVGGISPVPWHSLNLGGTVGDERENVVENRRRIFETIDRPVESIFDAWQVHGTDTLCADAPRPLDQPHQKADIILTDRPEITLLMRFADCVPIILVDPVRRVVGLVHAGWKGTISKAAGEAVEAMHARYGSRPQDIFAGIGPSICAAHYPVGEEVAEAARAAFGSQAGQVLQDGSGQEHLDLWEANRLGLERAGVQRIELCGICTAEHPQEWFSHRGEQGKTGRFGAVLALGTK